MVVKGRAIIITADSLENTKPLKINFFFMSKINVLLFLRTHLYGFPSSSVIKFKLFLKINKI